MGVRPDQDVLQQIPLGGVVQDLRGRHLPHEDGQRGGEADPVRLDRLRRASVVPRVLPRLHDLLLHEGGACSEQSSRMTAMDNSSKNAGEMIDKLTLTYNRTRQAVITGELIEIISGAAAL